jgi:glycosyltransferase involved in cell wall biosynthesis
MKAAAAISVVCSDTSENCLGRALVLAEVLAGFGEVRVVGPRLRDAVWSPAASSPIEVRDFRTRSAVDYFAATSWLRRELVGRRVVVSKPRATSLGLGLAAGLRAENFLLDIDDWELGFMSVQGTAAQRALQLCSHAGELFLPKPRNTYWSTRALDDYAQRVPRRLVSNSYLRERFGGIVLPHVRDTSALDPARFAGAARSKRAELGLGERPFVAFIGTIREHKGVDDLVQAVAKLDGPNAPGLLLAGVDFEHGVSLAVLDSARSLLPPERLRVVGMFDGAELPIWVALADVICIPSRDIPGTWGQIPAKLFDAMSMARPIVSSSVSDMATILDGCGLVFPGGDVAALSAQLARLCQDPELGRQLGEAARTRAIAQYSVASGRKAVESLVATLPVFEG